MILLLHIWQGPKIKYNTRFRFGS